MQKKYKTEWGLVTGSSSGIGKALAEKLCSQAQPLVLFAARLHMWQAFCCLSPKSPLDRLTSGWAQGLNVVLVALDDKTLKETHAELQKKSSPHPSRLPSPPPVPTEPSPSPLATQHCTHHDAAVICGSDARSRQV